MPAYLRNLLVILAVLSVGMLQIFGVTKGYFCACTGEETTDLVCEAVVCHPVDIHTDGCESDHHEEHGDRDPSAPGQDGHKHSEVRESLEMTGSSQMVLLPAAVFVVLSPAFQLPEVPTLTAGDEGPALPPDRSTPTPLLVARTMVMLV